ncbi:hypothetical protein K458DRAFT_118673 [Lentithecium fluviatile CBS 122367]|uniref:Rhodopsin domain-containing protein n=1 Tax=Lentithecium fluviatile CBS 122367 TaxID=1168545 RepID=A0A6G1IMA9_9PLEO|nr:hypothetical protein K458DRAFT_118673 [Lentithecium fluviatile CBS 122367]
MTMSRLEPESGIWYTICWLVLLTRLASRRIHHGSWKELKLDDLLICVAMVTMTILMVVMHIVVHTSSNLIAPGEDVSGFSQTEIDSRIYGSKLVLVVEQMQCCTIWLVKACLLLMYYRMTALLPQHKIVLFVAAYTALGFVVMEILYLGVWCRPFNQYWAIIPNSTQCSAATNHLITNAVLNLSSDIMIISIPMPLLFKVQLPRKNKAVLIGIFMIGAFNIIAAVLNKYYSFTHPFGTEWTEWYLRESYTAMLCANLPLTYPLIQRLFKLKNWSHHSYNGRYLSGSLPRHTTRSGLRSQRKSAMGLKSGLAHGGISKTVNVSVINTHSGTLQRSESEERINVPGGGGGAAKAFDGRGGETGTHAWGVAGALELGERSPEGRSQKTDGSVGSASIKSLERRH